MSRLTRSSAEPAATAAGRVARAASPARGTAAQRMLALQRTVGNAAAARLARRTLARCGCRTGALCSCGHHSPAPEEVEAEDLTVASLQHAVLARRRSEDHPGQAPQRMLQRRIASPMPQYQSKAPSWVEKGKDNPGADCTPFPALFGDSLEAQVKWKFYAKVLPDAVATRCGCELAGEAYAQYLEAKGGHFTLREEDGNCVSKQCATDDDAHHHLETEMFKFWRAKQTDIVRQVFAGGKTEATIDFVEAAIHGRVVPIGDEPLKELDVSPDVTYRFSTKAGGALLGSGNDGDVKNDSVFGPDTRKLTAAITLSRTDDGSEPGWVKFNESITWNYDVHDALDFCPGNSKPDKGLEPAKLAATQLLSDLSRLEASGMARDIEFNVGYHRATSSKQETFKPVPDPKPDPVPPQPDPAPPKPVPPKPGPRPTGKLRAALFLGPDGEPDPKLEACYEDRDRLREGDSGDPVARVQRALVEVQAGDLGSGGAAADGVDGIYGARTASVVRAFKAREALGSEQFGDVGPGTMHRLDDLLAG